VAFSDPAVLGGALGAAELANGTTVASFLIRGSVGDDLCGCSLGLLRIVLMRERPRRTLLKPFLSFPLFPSDCADDSSAGELMALSLSCREKSQVRHAPPLKMSEVNSKSLGEALL
jgi:hypothetical protein